MKKKLETPEDIKKALEALNDLSSDPAQFSVNTNFGYCGLCKEVTEYHINTGPEPPYILRCYGCGHRFKSTYVDGRGLIHYKHPFSANLIVYTKDLDKAPSAVGAKLERLLSREGQRELLADMVIAGYRKTKEEKEELKRQLQEKKQENFKYERLYSRIVTKEDEERNSK